MPEPTVSGVLAPAPVLYMILWMGPPPWAVEDLMGFQSLSHLKRKVIPRVEG